MIIPYSEEKKANRKIGILGMTYQLVELKIILQKK